MNILVIMSGGFHPFHAGHMALYQAAREQFPGANIVVGATDVQEKRPFPFKIKQKLAQLSGVPPKDFVQVQRQFSAADSSIFNRVKNPQDTVLIFVRSDKDKGKPPMPAAVDPATGKLPLVTRGANKGKPVSNYLQYYAGNENNLQPMTQHAYMAYLPTVEFGPGMTSATEIRAEWPTLDEQGKLDRVMSLYPRTQGNAKLAATVVKLLDAAMGTQGVAEGSLNEFAPGAGDEDGGEDPYKYPKPKRYARSADYFGQFEAGHFDRENFDDATGVFKGYWGRIPIAYFKFTNPTKTGSEDPGMGWYYEPESNSNSNTASAAPAVDRSAERKQQELGMIDAFLKSGQTPKPGSQIYSMMKRHGLAEGSLNEFAEKPEDGPGSDDYEDLLFHLAYEIWEDDGEADQAKRKLSLLGWKSEPGDDYTAIVLYKIGSDDHRQYKIEDFEEYGQQGVAEGSLNEFAPGGNSASSYYAVTANFVNDFAQQKQEELQDLIDAGWTKQDLAQAGTLQSQAADIVHFEQVRDGFLKGLKPGFDAYLQGDTQMKDQLGEYWIDNDLPLNQDWEKIYGEPWGRDEYDEGVAEGSELRKKYMKKAIKEVVHPDIFDKHISNEPTEKVRMGDFEFKARPFRGRILGHGNLNDIGLSITAHDRQNVIGWAHFVVKSDEKGNQWLESEWTEVDDDYMSRGVAAMMYAFAKSLGNDVKPSPHQSTWGKRMWKKWGKDAKHLVGEQGVAESFPQPGESSGKAKQFNPNAKVQTKEMTLDQILGTVKGIPYVNNVVDDWDAKDYSWGVTKKVIEYAKYLQKNPQSVANLPPLVVIDGQLNDGAHRLSAINLLQKRMDPKNPLWKQVKLKVNFGASADVASEQGVAEGLSNDMSTEDMIAYLRQHHDKNLHQDYLNHLTSTNSKFVLKNIPINSIRTELSGLDRAKVEQYKKMDFSKAPPIVVGSDGNILDGYHRATVAKALGIPTIKAYVGVKGQQGVAEGYSNTKFNVDRRKLNVPALIQKGAILVTHPHGEQGWETDNKKDWAFSLLSLYNVLQGGWASEAKKYLKPESYKRAEQQINSSAPNLGSDKLVYDGKYNQILWSIKKLGIPDNVAFLDKEKRGVKGRLGQRPTEAVNHQLSAGGLRASYQDRENQPIGEDYVEERRL